MGVTALPAINNILGPVIGESVAGLSDTSTPTDNMDGEAVADPTAKTTANDNTLATPVEITAAGMDNFIVENEENPTTNDIADDGVLDTEDKKHFYTRNYDMNSDAIESDGILLLMKKLNRQYKNEIFVEYVITDDGTKI